MMMMIMMIMKKEKKMTTMTAFVVVSNHPPVFTKWALLSPLSSTQSSSVTHTGCQQSHEKHTVTDGKQTATKS
jgi:hypothetical protein